MHSASCLFGLDDLIQSHFSDLSQLKSETTTLNPYNEFLSFWEAFLWYGFGPLVPFDGKGHWKLGQ